MPIQVDTRDCAALTDTDLDEMASMGGSFDIGVLSKAKEDWVLCTTARSEGRLYGFMFATLERIGGTPCVLIGLISVSGMLTVVGIIDNVPVVPPTFLEWRESLEYGLSIALAFLTGNILAMLIFVILPSTIASGGKPSAGAFRIAQMLGQHVGEEGLRRRARRIQDLMQTVGPLAGVVATAAGSAYTGLKGILGG